MNDTPIVRNRDIVGILALAFAFQFANKLGLNVFIAFIAGFFGLRLYRSIVFAHLLSISLFLLLLIPCAKIWGLVGVAMASNFYSLFL